MTEFVEKKCPLCGVSYALEKEYHDYWLRGGKPASWHCPNGHSLIFAETEADRLRRDNERLTQRLAEKDDDILWQRSRAERAERSASAYKGQTTKLRNRSKAGVCPCCNLR